MLSRIRFPYVIAAGLVALVLAIALAVFTSDDVALGRDNGDVNVEDGQELVGENAISLDEALEAAQGVATGPVDDIEIERHGDRVVYDIEIGNTDVLVDAQDGSIVSTRTDDDDDDDRDSDDVTDAEALAAAISVDEAIDIARGEATGPVRDVELEKEAGRLVYSVEIGQHEIEIDATDGTVLSVEVDD